MKIVGSLVQYNIQPWMQMGVDDYGIGLIVDFDVAWDQCIVLWANHRYGPMRWQHKQDELVFI